MTDYTVVEINRLKAKAWLFGFAWGFVTCIIIVATILVGWS